MADVTIASHPIAWFVDLHRRELLDVDPPYQRRSVWNHQYREYFIETLLLNYPVPPIFLHESISEDGFATYSIIDGKQRVLSIIEFVNDEFSVSEDSSIERMQGRYFSDLDAEAKTAFWRYSCASSSYQRSRKAHSRTSSTA